MTSKLYQKIILFLCFLITTVSEAAENKLFSFTHMLPSPFTLPAGRLVYGTELAFGVTDFLQVGTNILRDFFKFYNANAKVSLIDYPNFAFALTGGWESYNYKNISATNPSIQITSWMPGAVVSFALAPPLALFVGGNAVFSKTTLVTSGIETSGFIRGANFETDLSWSYNPQKKKRVGNVLSSGVSYDFTYKLYGLGISHHWPGFHFGVHYYPQATKYPLQPIIAGGGSLDI